SAAVAALGWHGRGTWSEKPRPCDHPQPVCLQARTPQRSRTEAATLGPVQSPPSGGECGRAAHRSICWSVESLLWPPSAATRRSARPAGPSAYRRFRRARARTAVRPTWAAAWAGARGGSGRVSSQRPEELPVGLLDAAAAGTVGLVDLLGGRVRDD